MATPSSRSPVPPPRRRRGLLVTGGLVLIAVLGLSAPILAKVPVISRLFAGGVTIERVGSRAEIHSGNSTILVEGDIVNRGGREQPTPAIRASLRSRDGSEVHSWLIQPTVPALAPGQSIGFRSALANPVPGAVHVALTLVERVADGQ